MSKSTLESDEVTEMYCEPCHRDELKYICIKGYCATCIEYLCAVCIRYHKKHLPGHVVQDEKEMPQDFYLDRCKLHPAEVVKFYCEICVDVACARCKIDRHRDCSNLQHLPKLSADFEKSTELKQLEKKINKATKDLNSVEDMIKTGNKRVEMLSTDVTKTMTRQRNNMNLKFDQFDAEIHKTVLNIKKSDQSQLKKQSERVDKVRRDLTALQSDIKNTKKSLQRCKLLIKTKHAKKEVDSMEEKLDQVKNEIVINDYEYEPFEYAALERKLGSIKKKGTITSAGMVASLVSNIYFEIRATIKLVKDLSMAQKYLLIIVMAFLAVFDIKAIVYVSFLIGTFLIIVKTTHFAAMVNDLITLLFSLFIKLVNWALRRIKNKNLRDRILFLQRLRHLQTMEINVKTQGDDRTCNISSLCLLSSNHLAAVDRVNCSVKIIDTDQGTVVTKLSFRENKGQGGPWDITQVGDDQLAVTLPDSQTVCFLVPKCSIWSHRLSVGRRISVHCTCYGIVYVDNKLAISSCDTGAVKIFDMDGNVLQSYSRDSSGRDMFDRPFYIAISPAHDTLYVSDYGRGHVTRLSMDGNRQSVYSKFADPFGMCVDNKGTLYVCGLYGIYKLSADLAQSQKLIEWNKMPNDIVFFNKNKQIYIASWGQDTIELRC